LFYFSTSDFNNKLFLFYDKIIILVPFYQIYPILTFISYSTPLLFVECQCLNSPNLRETRVKIVLSLFDPCSFRAFIVYARSVGLSIRQTDKYL